MISASGALTIGAPILPVIWLPAIPIRVVRGGAVRPNEPSVVVISAIALACAAGLPCEVIEANPCGHLLRSYHLNGIDVCLAVDRGEVSTLQYACIICTLECK